MVKVKYIGENDREIDFCNGEIYECLRVSQKTGRLIIIDESKEDYSYPPYLFELIKEDWQNEEDRNLAKNVQVRIEESKQYQQHEKNK